MSTWILLRGLMRERRHWGSFPGLLEKALPGACVVAVDLPGNGDLHALRSPTHLEDMVWHVRREMARLELPPPYHVLAMSLGAMVAAAWAEARPEELAGCILINTSFGGLCPLHHRMRPRAWPQLARFLLARSDLERERVVFGLTSRKPASAPEVVEAWTAIGAFRPVRRVNALRQMIAAARFRAPAAPRVPTLLLASAGDGLVDPRCSEAIARHWGCRLAMHPSAGHDLPLDDGEWILRQIRAWREPDSGKMGGGSAP